MTIPYAEVIGDPIAQSKSPLLHNFWLTKLGIAADYRARHVAADALGDYFAQHARDPDWRGCNITLPHKRAALDFVEDRGGLRDSIGAINCVLRAEDGALIGTNSDAGGFYAPIADVDLVGAEVVLIGAGGAARAILFALARCDVGHVTILNRDRAKAAELLPQFGLKGRAAGLDQPLPPAALLVNASPLGMTGAPPLVLDLSPLPDDSIVYEIVYSPLKTPLLDEAERRGLRTIDGLEMLIGQAAIAFELFFDAEPPREHDAELRALLTR